MRRNVKAAVTAEERFRAVFAHLGEVIAYARRRGSRDPDSIAAEAMMIAWRRLADVPRDDARPWLYATAHNLLLAEWRHPPYSDNADPENAIDSGRQFVAAPQLHELEPEMFAALESLGTRDREALLLIAWEDLTPALAARALGITQTAFRVRLHRARRRLQRELANHAPPSIHRLEVEEQ